MVRAFMIECTDKICSREIVAMPLCECREGPYHDL